MGDYGQMKLSVQSDGSLCYLCMNNKKSKESKNSKNWNIYDNFC